MMATTDAERLTEAQAAYHDLLRGESVRSIEDSNGERVVYTVADTGKLAAYIEQLKGRVSTASLGKRGPLRAIF